MFRFTPEAVSKGWSQISERKRQEGDDRGRALGAQEPGATIEAMISRHRISLFKFISILPGRGSFYGTARCLRNHLVSGHGGTASSLQVRTASKRSPFVPGGAPKAANPLGPDHSTQDQFRQNRTRLVTRLGSWIGVHLRTTLLMGPPQGRDCVKSLRRCLLYMRPVRGLQAPSGRERPNRPAS